MISFLRYLEESTLKDLFQNMIKAFPKTELRQNATDEIEIEGLKFTPFRGVKTLLVRAEAINIGKHTHYSPLILFKKVQYNSDGLIISDLSYSNSDVLLRCNCQDFRWRFNYFNSLDKSLYGTPRSEYEAKFRPGSSNPQKIPGMCKHLIALSRSLDTLSLDQINKLIRK